VRIELNLSADDCMILGQYLTEALHQAKEVCPILEDEIALERALEQLIEEMHEKMGDG
jgi:hypothetical protein